MNSRPFFCTCACLLMTSCAEKVIDREVSQNVGSTSADPAESASAAEGSHANHDLKLGHAVQTDGHETNSAHGSHGEHTAPSKHGIRESGEHSTHNEHAAGSKQALAGVTANHKSHKESSPLADKARHSEDVKVANHAHGKPAKSDHSKPQHHHGDGNHSKSDHPKSNHAQSDHAKSDRVNSDHGHAKPNPYKAAGEFVRTGEATIAKTIAAAVDNKLANLNPAEIFTSRILPIARAERSSSCTECHFSGVELRDYIVDDQTKTFASLKSGGLINVEQPDKSKLLRFIARSPAKSDVLKDKVRKQELIAFRAWIRAAVKDPDLLKAMTNAELGTKVPTEIIRHARKDRVLSSFLDNIWSEMGRCINCHSPDRNRNKIGRNGFTKEDVDAISWIVPRDPAATLKQLVDSGNIDLDDPSASPVLTKPAGLAEHKGGPKFFPGSPTYRNFLAFLIDYAAITNSKYQKVTDLPVPPTEMILPSKQQLRIVRIPASFSGKSLQVDLYRRIRDTGKWSEHRWATIFSRVNGQRNVWQNPVLLAAPAGSKLAAELRKLGRLPAGSYLAKIYVDQEGKTVKDPSYILGEREYVGQVEVNGEWKPGYQPPKIVSFPRLRD